MIFLWREVHNEVLPKQGDGISLTQIDVLVSEI